MCGDESKSEVFHCVHEVDIGQAWGLGDGDERSCYVERVYFVLRLGKECLD